MRSAILAIPLSRIFGGQMAHRRALLVSLALMSIVAGVVSHHYPFDACEAEPTEVLRQFCEIDLTLNRRSLERVVGPKVAPYRFGKLHRAKTLG